MNNVHIPVPANLKRTKLLECHHPRGHVGLPKAVKYTASRDATLMIILNWTDINDNSNQYFWCTPAFATE